MNDASREDGRWIRSAVEAYEQRLVQYATHILRDADRAQDVVQDTFCRLCRQQRCDVEDHLAEWLFTVTRNRALDVLRKERRMRRLSDQHLDNRHADGVDPQAPAEHDDETRLVLAAIAELPERDQEVVRLKFQQGLTYRQIARITEMSIGNVGYVLHGAIGKVRKRLGVEISDTAEVQEKPAR